MATPNTLSRKRSSRPANRVKSLGKSASSQAFARGLRKGKVRKEFWLDPKLLRTVREELGVATEREAVEMALDLVVFRKELAEGARRLVGLNIASLDDES
jgi:Arc/MetJ family transcription regulator